MPGDGYELIAVSRRIGSPASEVFRILADPGRHRDLDGSGMLRGVVSGAKITGAGDVFVMAMYFTELGDYEMNNHVVEYELDRRIGWEPVVFELTTDGADATVVTEIFDCSRVPEDERADIDKGNIWVGTITVPLERLDELCAGQPGVAGVPGQR